MSHNESEMSYDSSGVRSGVGPDRSGYLPNWEKVRSLVRWVQCGCISPSIVHSLQSSQGFQGCQAGCRMEENEN